MRLSIWAWDRKLGECALRDGKVVCSGRVQGLLELYQNQGFQGEALLRHMARRLQSYTWAKWEEGPA